MNCCRRQRRSPLLRRSPGGWRLGSLSARVTFYENSAPRFRRSARRMTWSLLKKYWPFLSLAALFAMLLPAGASICATLPPRTIVMATGPRGGSNYELGDRYREILAQSGIELKLLPTSG